MARWWTAFLILILTLLSTESFAATCVAGDAGKSRYNAALGTMEYCTGSTWVSMRNSIFTACNSNDAGKTRFLTSASDMQFCDGDSWYSMYNATVTTCSVSDLGKMRYNSGAYQFCDGTNWNSSGVTLTTRGFFILSSTAVPGNMDNYGGGLAGANALCLDELKTYDWQGKASAGPLTASRVRAWLCDDSTCNNLKASTTYQYAVAGYPAAGGNTFTSDSSSRGPNDATDWSAGPQFGGSLYVWTGRALSGSSNILAGTTPLAGSTCNGFNSWSASYSGSVGVTGNTDKQRWNYTTHTCDNYRNVICLVDPPIATPNPFAFIDQSGLNVSTLTTSNIVQITGISGTVFAGVSGAGSPQYRVCTDPTCSTAPSWISSGIFSTIPNNGYLQARATTSPNTGVPLVVQVSVGGSTTKWTLTTSGTATGYFVLVPPDDKGNDHGGGRIWMDILCRGQLQRLPWLNQAEAGTLTENRVHAWTCAYGLDCWTLQPNTKYQFATAGSASIGGGTFITDSNGLGPGNSTPWNTATTFGMSVKLATARAAGTSTSFNNAASTNGDCYGWSNNTSAANYDAGNTALSGTSRWGGAITTCDQPAYVVCAVDPITTFSAKFTPTLNADLLTVVYSEIVPLAGMNANTKVYVDTIGYMQFRLCGDATCSSVVQDWTYSNKVASSSNYLQMRMTSSPYPGTTLRGNLYVGTGGNAFPWSVTTAGTAANGYLVLTNNSHNGNFGGLSGGAGLCLTELNSYNWRGKSSAGTLNSSRVRMFGCDASSCNTPRGNSTYLPAVANDTVSGGSPMQVDDAGYFPGIYQAWNSKTVFGDHLQYWTGYNWNSRSAAPQPLFEWDRRSQSQAIASDYTCAGWTSAAAGVQGTVGDSVTFDQRRFEGFSDTCDKTYRYLCLVDPAVLPTTFSFTNQTAVALSTLRTSDIKQVNGLTAPSLVSLTPGAGDPSYRICDDATCSTAPAWQTVPRSITSGKYLQMQITSAPASLRANTATINVGGYSTTWSVTTADTCSHGNAPFTSANTFTVPAGCGNVTIKAWGAGGGGGNGTGGWAGGAGAFVTGQIKANPGDVLIFNVGGAGATGTTTRAGGTGGGGQGFGKGGAGGGATSVSFSGGNIELASSWTPRYSNLVSYFRMNGSGSVGNTGIIPATVGPNAAFVSNDASTGAYVAGVANQSLTFDGLDDRIRVPSFTGLDDAKQFTSSIWVKFNSLADNAMIYDKSTDYKIQFNLSSSYGADLHKLNFAMTTSVVRGSVYSMNDVLLEGKWQNIVITYDGTQASNTERFKMYVDGVAQPTRMDNGNDSVPSVFLKNSADLTFGAVGFESYSQFNGAMDEMAFWNVALTPTEVGTLYARQGPLMVAAGGGGGGITTGGSSSISQVGGAGGNATAGSNGGAGDTRAGRGATATAGGAAGNGTGGTNGASLAGGNGTTRQSGGGGSGWWGGGGGSDNGTANSGGGGGGTSYISPYASSPTVTGGSGTTPGGNGDTNYSAGSGVGGTGGASPTSGGAGYLYISY